MWQLFTELDRTTRSSVKLDALVRYFREAPAEDAVWALHLLSGRRFKRLIDQTLERTKTAELATSDPGLAWKVTTVKVPRCFTRPGIKNSMACSTAVAGTLFSTRAAKSGDGCEQAGSSRRCARFGSPLICGGSQLPCLTLHSAGSRRRRPSS